MADQEEKVEQQEETHEGAEPEAPEAESAAEAAAPAEEPAAAKPEAAEASAEEPAAAPEPEKPEYTFEVLHKMTVSDLRDIAQGMEHEALTGYSTMHKEQLVPALCQALGIEAHVHHEVVGIDKAKVKAKIKDLKVERAQAIEAGDHAQLKLVRSRIKSLKRKIRRATI